MDRKKQKKSKKLFVDGSISPRFIADSIGKHQKKTGIGAHQIFLGQIRADNIEDKTVQAIHFTAYTEMAEEKYYEIQEEIFESYNLTCMHVYHSLGTVKAGEINLFVFVSSKHRNDATEACRNLVERIKNDLPVWGREIFEDSDYQWKVNR